MAITPQGGPGIGWGLKPLVGNNNMITLQAGESYIIPAGQYYVAPGSYSNLQTLDPITGLWRGIGNHPSQTRFVTTDGVNVRIANLTGCAVGGYVTNVGSGYTSAPTVTASAGGSTWTAIVGGAVSSSVTVGTAGTGYTYPPQVVFSAPPAGGVQATGYSTLSGATVGSVTVTNQGAGYVTAPTVTFVNDPRDTTGVNAAATTALTGSGTITAVLCTNQGTPQTTVPTLSFAGGGGSAAAATVVMAFAATGFTVSNAGVAYGNAQPFAVITAGGIVGGAAGAVVNPAVSTGLFTPRQANFSGTTTGASVITATGSVVNDGGLFQAVPNGFVLPSGTSALPTTTAIVAITVGGVTDTTFIQPVG